ncbi:MAG: response regulator [Sedimentisphaerales bacterium]|jgi:DNA-binding NtrC family response regulator
MVADLLQSDADSTSSPQEINVLASQANWDWPLAVRDIFRPRGVNLLVAENANDIVNVLRHRRIRTTLVDTDPEQGGLWILKIIRTEQPLMPCILLTSEATGVMLEEALQLDVFSVIDKPVDMNILKDQLNRLFIKNYGSHIFSA